MRMWMIDPALLCRRHLLGEHVETHMLAGALQHGKRIHGYLDRGLVEPQHLTARHAALAAEMVARGYRHRSPLKASGPAGTVDRAESLKELCRRCPECRERIEGRRKEEA